ncbi:MAG TPA: hypothetical protein VHV27_01450 [Phenylobacterium sp.]|jgi:hypothetical protein|nr:hypothetical protein [Phenylobacterium sp.]
MTIFAASVFAACAMFSTQAIAGPEFLSYEGPDAVQTGKGGEKKIVAGVDFWMDGTPARKFQVLGSLRDQRHETGLFGAIRMSSYETDIAKAAKAAGGDAVILQSESEEVTGRTGFADTQVNGTHSFGSFSGGAFTSMMARDMKNHKARFLVVKYLDQPQPPSPAPAADQK